MGRESHPVALLRPNARLLRRAGRTEADHIRIISARRATKLNSTIMKKMPQSKRSAKRDDGLRPEYHFDYAKARPNRFAAGARPGSVAVLLDPDVAQVFKNAASVNAVLRALVATMPTRRASTKRAD